MLTDEQIRSKREGSHTKRVCVEILAERLRQISDEGWSLEHDDKHSNGEMAQAAACYADYSALGEDMIIECDED
ncbi:MAG TPA: hypothetical protein PKH39_16265, partial [Woeseiaceae bacterium]|nr:hypothetical protein [Woeseiaceae bacterium]